MTHDRVAICCVDLSSDEVNALRRLLNLLASHLSHPCELVDSWVGADLVIVNMDVPTRLPQASAATVVGCSIKPSLHPQAKLHRPIRAYELLAVLNEIRPASLNRSDQTKNYRYRLREWPLDLAAWNGNQLKIMSAITREASSVPEVAMRTGVVEAEVAECLEALQREGLVETEVVANARVEARHFESRWQKLTARLGQLLGFSR